MNFDTGDSDYIEVPKNDTLGLVDTNFSISIWINPDVSHQGLVMQNYSGATGWGVYYQSGNIRFYDAPAWTTVTTINTSEWTHILIVGDYTGSNLICYKNGVEVYNSSHTFTITESTENVFIGSERGTGFFFDGDLSNIAIWNKVLTQDEILRVYNGGSPGDLTSLGPTSWWSLGADSYFNGSDWICPDIGANTNNGTSANMGADALVGNGPNSLANGTSTNLDLASDLIGEAPGSTGNAISINMNSLARTGSTP